jgi:hypothetical protein
MPVNGDDFSHFGVLCDPGGYDSSLVFGISYMVHGESHLCVFVAGYLLKNV